MHARQLMQRCWSAGTGAILVITCIGCALPTGVLKSRWAMDDPEYASKYADGAPKTEPLQKIKQAADARFLEKASGIFVSGGITRRPDADNNLFAIDVGGEHYLTSYLTGRVSLVGMVNDDWFTGADAGMRLQTPTRLAPFVGLGIFGGWARETVDASDDWIDNDDDGFTDEYGEEKKRVSGSYFAAYPETGFHLWWTPRIRLTTYGRYLISDDGRDSDDWMFGTGIAIFTNPIGL